MKRKVLFYIVFGLILTGSVSLVALESNKVSDVVSIASSDNSSEMSNHDERLEEIAEHAERIGEDL